MRQFVITGLITLMATTAAATAQAGVFNNAINEARSQRDIVKINALNDEKVQRSSTAKLLLSHIDSINGFQPKLQGTAKMRFDGKTVDDLTNDGGFIELMTFKIGIFQAAHQSLMKLPSQSKVKADRFDWAKLMANALRQEAGPNTGSAFLLLLAELEKSEEGRQAAEGLRRDYADLLPSARWDVADASTIEPAAGDDTPVKSGYVASELNDNDFLALKGTNWDIGEELVGDTEIDVILPDDEGNEEDTLENPNNLSPNTPLPIV